MHLKNLHTQPKPVSAIPVFKTEQSTAISIQILQGEKLKEHITKVPALLICVEGQAIYEDENGKKENLLAGDYVAIEPMVKHWVEGTTTCQLVLFK